MNRTKIEYLVEDKNPCAVCDNPFHKAPVCDRYKYDTHFPTIPGGVCEYCGHHKSCHAQKEVK